MNDLDIDKDQSQPAPFQPGDRVYVKPLNIEATVICQQRQWDYPESFWGNIELVYDDGQKGISHSWQVEKITPCTCHPDDNPPVPCARKYALTECSIEHERTN